MALDFESWDDDGELQGDIFTTSLSTVKTSLSSRLSVRSESIAGDDEDWNVSITPTDHQATAQAILSAKQAGIPLPSNIPASALLGGSIKRLGKKISNQSILDDWADDIDFHPPAAKELKVKTGNDAPAAFSDEHDDFDDWAEGSLGVRFGGTRRDSKNRKSSASALSPSMDSCMTMESEDDGLEGLIIPLGPLNFEAALKRVETLEDEKTVPSSSIPPPSPRTISNQPEAQREDFLSGIDIGSGEVFDLRKRTLNKNLKPAWKSSTKPLEPSRVLTTLTFIDKASSTKIPRPVIGARTGKLDPVIESGSTNITRPRRQPEAPAVAQHMLRSKRSIPSLRSQVQAQSKVPAVPFLPAGIATAQSHHIRAKPSIQGVRRDSDPSRVQSPPPRPNSRLSQVFVPDTPTRARHTLASSVLLREAAAKRPVTRPLRRRNFGDGTELDLFDDLPTSAAKEIKFTKQPTLRPAQKTLRNQPSHSKLPWREKPVAQAAPVPASPKSPTKTDNLPRFARDTAASRIAREQKLGHPKGKADGALAPRINWAAQIAARTPHVSPTANRTGRKGPQLVNPMGKENIRQFQDDAAKKGMHWNAALCRWEGNDNVLDSFETAAPISPPRPALITNVSGAQGVQVVGGMVFDPHKMCWLKLGADGGDVRSPSTGEDDDDDPFGGIEDLKDTTIVADVTVGTRGAAVGNEWLVGEEFDLGPEFIRRQREEEATWRLRVNAWFGHGRYLDGDDYKWAIREIAATVSLS